MPGADWNVYLLRTRLDTLYTGIAVDVPRRIREHEASAARGAKYLRSKGPLRLEYQVSVGPRERALQVEHRVKRLPRAEKERLIAERPGAGELLGWLGIE